MTTKTPAIETETESQAEAIVTLAFAANVISDRAISIGLADVQTSQDTDSIVQTFADAMVAAGVTGLDETAYKAARRSLNDASKTAVREKYSAKVQAAAADVRKNGAKVETSNKVLTLASALNGLTVRLTWASNVFLAWVNPDAKGHAEAVAYFNGTEVLTNVRKAIDAKDKAEKSEGGEGSEGEGSETDAPYTVDAFRLALATNMRAAEKAGILADCFAILAEMAVVPATA